MDGRGIALIGTSHLEFQKVFVDQIRCVEESSGHYVLSSGGRISSEAPMVNLVGNEGQHEITAVYRGEITV